jgi:hypothetical protein
MAKIEEIFFLPPMAVARLGGSNIPLASFTWAEDPSLQGAGLTVITPDTSLEVLADGSIRPFLPAFIQFRDGKLLRPVAPFLELWVRSDSQEQPLTLKWLQQQKAKLSAVTYTVTAANRKAARRTGDPACAFSATVTINGDDHKPYPLLASSAGENPLVLQDHPIPLGYFQVIQPTPTIASGVDLSVLRVRFTPAKGLVYGPPSATMARDPDLPKGPEHELVPAAHRFLNPNSSWLHYSSNDRPDSSEPADTYDGADDPTRRNRSFGVVDDTCDVILQASLVIGRKTWKAVARIFVAPPDFAPDRRPFCSLAEELLDRDPPSRETAEHLPDAVERLGDLFQRVFETASLANVDMMRNDMMPRDDTGIRNFPGLPQVTRAASMTPKDTPYFDKTEDLNSPPSSHEKLPYASVAQQTHAPLANTDDMAEFLANQRPQLRRLIRPAYAHFKDLEEKVRPDQKPDPAQRDPRILRDAAFDMRMPPYMRDADATPLSLNRRQYEFLMQTTDRLQPRKAERGLAAAPAEFTRTQDHVARVAQRRARTRSHTPAAGKAGKDKQSTPASGKKGRKA